MNTTYMYMYLYAVIPPVTASCCVVDVCVRMSRVPHNPHGMKPVNLLDIWEDLSRGIRHIYSRESMPKKRYMELYTYPPLCS